MRITKLFFLIAALFCTNLCLAEGSESILFAESVRLFQDRKYEESYQLLKDLLKNEPQKSVYWFNLATCLFMLKKYDKALKLYEKVISLNTSFVEPAKLYRVKTFKMLGLHDRASSALESLRQTKLSPGLELQAQLEQETLDHISAAEEAALDNYKKGNFNQSENTLKSLSEESLSLDGRMLLGLSLLKQKKIAESERLFYRLTNLSSLSSEQRSLALELLHKSRNNESETHPYWLFLDTSYGNTSNAYLDGKSTIPVSSSLTRASFGFGYHFDQGQEISEKLGYSLTYETPDQVPELKTLIQTIQAPLVYQQAKTVATLTPHFQSQAWNNVSVAQKIGVTLKGAHSAESHEFGIEIEGFSQEATNSSYSYLKGSGSSFKPYLEFWTSSFYAQIYWVSGSDESQDIAYSDGSKLPISQVYQGPGFKGLVKLSDTAIFSLGLSFIQHDFKNVALPSQNKRKDQETTGFLKFANFFLPQLSGYGLAEYIANSSTLGSSDARDKNYDVTIFSVGISWDVF